VNAHKAANNPPAKSAVLENNALFSLWELVKDDKSQNPDTPNANNALTTLINLLIYMARRYGNARSSAITIAAEMIESDRASLIAVMSESTILKSSYPNN